MRQRGWTIIELLGALIALACFGGWVANIYKLCNMGFDHITGLMVARGIGIIVGPLGAVLGYF